MSQDTITVALGRGRAVTVKGESRYLGTDTAGARNIERYEVTVMGVACQGTWDGDARHNTVVEVCPAELRAKLLPTYRSQAAARRRKAEAEAIAAERKFYGRAIR